VTQQQQQQPLLQQQHQQQEATAAHCPATTHYLPPNIEYYGVVCGSYTAAQHLNCSTDHGLDQTATHKQHSAAATTAAAAAAAAAAVEAVVEQPQETGTLGSAAKCSTVCVSTAEHNHSHKTGGELLERHPAAAAAAACINSIEATFDGTLPIAASATSAAAADQQQQQCHTALTSSSSSASGIKLQQQQQQQQPVYSSSNARCCRQQSSLTFARHVGRQPSLLLLPLLCVVLLLLLLLPPAAAQQPMPFQGRGDNPPSSPVDVHVTAYVDRILEVDDRKYEFSVSVLIPWGGPNTVPLSPPPSGCCVGST